MNRRLEEDFNSPREEVRWLSKVMCRLMFGILVLTADPLFRILP